MNPTHLNVGHSSVSVVDVCTSGLDFDLVVVHGDVQVLALHTRQIGVELVIVVLQMLGGKDAAEGEEDEVGKKRRKEGLTRS